MRGFGLKAGALGSTVAHDAHNVVVVGTTDSDIVAAIEALKELRGGQVSIRDGEIQAALALPIFAVSFLIIALIVTLGQH